MIDRFKLVRLSSGALDSKPVVEQWVGAAYEEPALTSGHVILGVTMTAADYEQPVAVMKRGYLRDVYSQNSESWSIGDILYGKSDGSITKTRPAGPLPQVIVGTVFDTYTDQGENTVHTIDVDVRVLPSIAELSGVTRETLTDLDVLIYNGTTHAWVPRQIDHGGDIAGLLDDDHPLYQRKHGFEVSSSGAALVTLTYSKVTKKITLTPTLSTFRFWIDGVEFIKTGAQTSGVAHGTTTGKYFIYYNSSGVLTTSAVETPWSIRDRTVTPVALVYWNNTLSDGWCFYECHTADRTLEQHYHDHFSEGTQRISGGALTGYTLATDTSAGVTFAVSATTIADEDIVRTLSAVADNGPYMTLWRTGAAGDWTFNDTRTLPWEYDVGANYIAYNNPDAGGAGIWGLTSAGASSFIPYFLFATTSIQTARQIFLIPAQAFTGSLTAAQAYTLTNLAYGTLPFEEVVPLYRIIYRTGAGYGTSGRGRIEQIDSISGNTLASLPGTPSDHNSLGGRTAADVHPASSVTFTPYSSISSVTVQAAIEELAASALVRTVGITIDGGGSEITAGLKGFVQIPFSGTITRWTLLADTAGDIVIDVWKDTLANYPPTVADTIAGAEKPTLSAAQAGEDTNLTTWTTAVTAGDVLGFNVDSVATLTRATLILWVTTT